MAIPGGFKSDNGQAGRLSTSLGKFSPVVKDVNTIFVVRKPNQTSHPIDN